MWAGAQAKRGLWGRKLLDQMEHYNHQVGLKIVGECLPQERNGVTLTEIKDQYGLPVPRITYSYCDADCRCWDIPNLWVCDGSVFPTVGGVNPSLTIQAIACRTADRIKALAARGEL